MKDQYIVLGQGKACFVEPEDACILTCRWEKAAFHTLELDAKDLDDIRIFDGILNPLVNKNARFFIEVTWQQCLGASDVYLHPHFAHAVDIRARDATVQDIAEDGDFQACQLPFMFLNRKKIQ